MLISSCIYLFTYLFYTVIFNTHTVNYWNCLCRTLSFVAHRLWSQFVYCLAEIESRGD